MTIAVELGHKATKQTKNADLTISNFMDNFTGVQRINTGKII